MSPSVKAFVLLLCLLVALIAQGTSVEGVVYNNANNKTAWLNGGAQGQVYIYGESITVKVAGANVTSVLLEGSSTATHVWILNRSATPVIIGILTVGAGNNATGNVYLPYAGLYYFAPGKNTSTWTDRYNISASPIDDQSLFWNGSTYFDCTGNGGRGVGTTCGAANVGANRRNILAITMETADAVPTFSFTSTAPANYTYSHNVTPTFTFSGDYTTGPFNVTLYINGTAYGKNVTYATGVATNITANASLPQGAEYLWWLNATANGFSTISEKRNLYVTGGSGSATTLACLVISNGCTVTSANGCNYVQ